MEIEMLKKMSMLLILSILANAENVKNINIEKFNLNDIKECSEPNKELLCKDKHEAFIYKDILYFENEKTPTCDNKLENMYIFSERTHSIDSPKIETTKNDNKITTKQTYISKIISSHKIGACKTNSEIIIKTENK
jgi:hypothetical protein